MPQSNRVSEGPCVLIHAPYGKDAKLIQAEAQAAGFLAEVCHSIGELCSRMNEGAAVALIADEALVQPAVQALTEQLDMQPPWSDFPLLVLTSGGGSDKASRYRASLLEPLGNVTLLERPLRPVTLVSSLRAALRARLHQHQLREYVMRIEESEQALRHSEARLRFLGELGEAIRALTNPNEIVSAVATLLGIHLQVSRCAYASVESDSTRFTILSDYTAPGCTSTAGHYHLSFFGPRAMNDMHNGRTLVIHDIELELSADDGRDMFMSIGIQAIICCPLMKSGQLVAMMAVHQVEPRQWRPDEVDLVRQAVNRCWESIVRASFARELKEREERYRFLAESIPQMVWTATPDGLLDYINGPGAAFFGAERETLLGVHWLRNVHPEDAEQALNLWNKALSDSLPYETSFRLLRGRDNQWRWHLARGLPLIDRTGEVVQWFGTCTDIQDQKATEAELLRANRELEEFAYVASHDLQEPLRMVNIYTQLMLRHVAGEDVMMSKYAGFVRQGVSRMEVLIHDLLTFSRTVHTEGSRTGKANLTKSLNDALFVLRSRIEEGNVSIHAQQLPIVRGETAQITHVFQNVLSNALKYREKDRPLKVVISAQLKRDEWVIAITDNGIGFNQQYAERIFGLFKRLHKEEYPGTGLGLAICKRIIERYGGRMWATSEAGVGSTFYFALKSDSTPDELPRHIRTAIPIPNSFKREHHVVVGQQPVGSFRQAFATDLARL